MYRTLIKRCSFAQLTPRLNIHLSTPKVEEVTNQNVQTPKSDDVKFEYINKTGVVLLNKPKTLNALSLPMIEQIYPQLKVSFLQRMFLFNKQSKFHFSNGNLMAKLS